MDSVATGPVDKRSVRDIAIGGVTDRQLRRPFREECRVILDEGRGNQMATRGHAHLTGIVERAEAAYPGCVLDVRVIQDYECGIAAQLQVHSLEKRSSEPGNFAPGGH